MPKTRPMANLSQPHPLRSSVPNGPQSIADLRNAGSRSSIIQISAPRHVYRSAYLRADESANHELVTQPLASPTGPGGAQNFHNRAGSQLARPQVTNVYLGPFWGDRAFLEGFSKAIVEYGYLQPLAELNAGTGPGDYLGPIDGTPLAAGSRLTDADAQALIANMIDAGTLVVTQDCLFMLILPTGVVSILDAKNKSCSSYCGYHEAFDHNGAQVAYAVLPSPVGCAGCGNGAVGDFTAVYGHELAEAATDTVPGQGWVADDGQENGDLEAWILFGWGPPIDPSRYTIQGYYTNERGNTVGAWTGPNN